MLKHMRLVSESPDGIRELNTIENAVVDKQGYLYVAKLYAFDIVGEIVVGHASIAKNKPLVIPYINKAIAHTAVWYFQTNNGFSPGFPLLDRTYWHFLRQAAGDRLFELHDGLLDEAFTPLEDQLNEFLYS